MNFVKCCKRWDLHNFLKFRWRHWLFDRDHDHDFLFQPINSIKQKIFFSTAMNHVFFFLCWFLSYGNLYFNLHLHAALFIDFGIVSFIWFDLIWFDLIIEILLRWISLIDWWLHFTVLFDHTALMRCLCLFLFLFPFFSLFVFLSLCLSLFVFLSLSLSCIFSSLSIYLFCTYMMVVIAWFPFPFCGFYRIEDRMRKLSFQRTNNEFYGFCFSILWHEQICVIQIHFQVISVVTRGRRRRRRRGTARTNMID